MIPREMTKALDALRAINAEWATEIDLRGEYLSKLFDEFGAEDVLSIVEDMLLYLDAYICDNPLAFSAPDFHDMVHDVLHEYFEGLHAFEFSATMDLEADALCCFCEALYFRHVHPPRESGNTFIRKPPNAAVIDAKLAHIRGKPQPDQRTPEWYTFRHNLLTASNAWKAFESQACMNQLIYEKCKPLKEYEEKEYVNTASPLHWGQKYEPVSRMIYEHLYKTKVADFGCLQHDTHAFLGASPDGINVDPASERYGRMLEIKNVVNRDITGIPKKEYWIQMQLQMETANLNECDFLETQFVECDNDNDNNQTNHDKLKGIILYFMKDGKPHYEYEPIGCTRAESEAWFSEAMEINQAHMWVKTIHWRLESMSCVLVLRNKFWFRHAIRVLEGLWKTVECERNDPAGYEHRAPKRRSPATAINASASASATFMQNWLVPPERKCLIDVSCMD